MALLIRVIKIRKLVKVTWVFTSWRLLLQGYFFGNSKHGVNSIVPIHSNPKLDKVTFLKCGLGMEKWV
jgi:hypothetical protein